VFYGLISTRVALKGLNIYVKWFIYNKHKIIHLLTTFTIYVKNTL